MNNQRETPQPAPTPAAGVLIYGALFLSGASLLALALSPLTGARFAPQQLWGIAPQTYIGAVLLLAGLGLLALLHLAHRFLLRARAERAARRRAAQYWVDTTRRYFAPYNHDLGRPLRRILDKERELRDLLAEQQIAAPPEVHRLLDEIETQTPAFRLMLGNLHALIELETPEPTPELWPVEPAEIANKIVLRYQAAAEQGKDLVWIPESQEPSIIASSGHALEHILANLVDNALRHAAGYVEVALTREENALTITVEDDGPGIP